MKNAITLCDFNRFVPSTLSRNVMLHSILYRPLNQVLSLKSLFCLIYFLNSEILLSGKHNIDPIEF